MRKTSELSVAFLLLVLTLVVGVCGYLLYDNLHTVYTNVAESYNKKKPRSEMVRQILVEFRDAESYAKSYDLSRNDDVLLQFYLSCSTLDSLCNLFRDTSARLAAEKPLFDSIIVLAESRLGLLKKQIYIDDEKKITDELNAISSKIHETSHFTPTLSTDTDTPKPEPKKSFVRKLFTKKSKEQEKARISDSLAKIARRLEISEKKMNRMTQQLQATVKNVKGSQFDKLQKREQYELEITEKGKSLMDRLRSYYQLLLNAEKDEETAKIHAANQKVNNTRLLGIAVSAVVSILLLVASFSIVLLWRKKKQYESGLIDARDKAEDLAKAKEMFLANMSHEIKTPLNAIYGFTEQVLVSGVSTKQSEHLGIVKKSAIHLSKLITDILSYSKIQAGKIGVELSNTDLRDEIDDIRMMLGEQAASKKIGLIVNVSESVPKAIQTDLTKLRQILLNLSGNAIKFTHQGYVKINVDSRNSESPDPAPRLHITISDTGIGIPATEMDKLFQEYHQAHRGLSETYGGTGLGLVITKRLIEVMGGSISLSSVENEGTEVTIQIPYKIATTKENTSEKIKQSSYTSLQSLKIMVADDEAFNRLLVSTILNKGKAKVTMVVNGQELVDKMKQERYDLLIVDVNMPVLNGIDACRAIRKLNIEQPIILASTAVADEEKLKEASEAGFDGFLNKPFTEEELVNALTHHLKLSGSTDQHEIKADHISALGKKFTLNFAGIDELAHGDQNFRQEMLQIFYTSINTALPEIKKLCVQKSWKEAAMIAHKTMPSCKYLDASELYQTFAYFDKLSKMAPSEPELSEQLLRLEENIELVNHELKVYL